MKKKKNTDFYGTTEDEMGGAWVKGGRNTK
jgi:hypothetical protein